MKTGKPRFFYGYAVVSIAFFISLMACGPMYIFGVFFKPLLAEFGWTRATISSAYSLRHLVFGLVGILGGRLNDRFGPRIVVTACGIFLGLGYLLMPQVSDIWHLYLFYGVIIAIGMSGAYVPLLSTVARWFVKRRGVMTGIVLAGVSAATMIMPPIAEWLISNFGWRLSFVIMGIVSLISVVAAAQFLKDEPSQVGQQPYGSGAANKESPNPVSGGFSFERAVRTRQLWMLFVALFCQGFSLQAIMVHIVPHVTDLGISALMATSVLTTIGGLSLGGKVIVGSIADRLGNKRTFAASFVLMSVTLLWLLIAREMWALYLFAVVFGFAYGGLIPLGSPLAAELFGLQAIGAIFGVVAFGGTLGGAVSPTLAGYLFDITGNYQLAFLLLSLVAASGAIITSLLRPVASKEK